MNERRANMAGGEARLKKLEQAHLKIRGTQYHHRTPAPISPWPRSRWCYFVPDTNAGARTSSASRLDDGSLIVMRQSVRGSSGSVSVAECSSEALSQITTSPTR